ncbi:aminoacetone oxidase family FAD-binding enzyme [Fusibacter paucivorans]|uniref:Aminoacetone oxidase family FAD-binding enzyme n=1 Tax=Fusibacter paucivorans TaxID=76009 RepID=A0ABS5PKC0_9FIRM|nr:aminoacetone oxidase family FAD-binding enzyme [Fusibacter paucivorans]MBS7525615.1 aminoacetone oxidase family FAD-binding enzyme [Fusibacter paucivorans]
MKIVIPMKKGASDVIWECVIVGAGASGLYAAAQLEMQNVLVLEKKHRAGLKLGVSGGGQCNLTHEGYAKDFFDHYGAHKSFVKHALKAHDASAVRQFFKHLGVETVTREDGKIFPADFRARSVIRSLINRIENLGHVIQYQQRVTEVAQWSNGFLIKTKDAVYHSKRVIIATGGQSYPSLGSEGDGYALAEMLHLPLTAVAPGLTGILCSDKALAALSGVGLSAINMVHYPSQKQYTGDLLITHFGLSGPVIINNSRDFKAGDRLGVNWLGEDPGKVQQRIKSIIEANGGQHLRYLLNQFELPDRLKSLIISRMAMDEQRRLAEFSRENRQQLMTWLTAYPIAIKKLQGYDTAMVTVGGIATTAISSKTMAAKNVDNLYIVGELMDIDGDTGGYNLQWAFSSAYAAVQAILSTI